MTNPLEGVDNLITDFMLIVADREMDRVKGQSARVNAATQRLKDLRTQIRSKVAQANVILNGIVVDAGAERYKHLLEAEQQLGALLAAGVDNWEGYADAMAQTKE